MANIATKRFNWVRSPSAWERSQTWRDRQQEARASFEASSTDANSRFFGASINLAQGLGAITAQIASKRLQVKAINAALSKLV